MTAFTRATLSSGKLMPLKNPSTCPAPGPREHTASRETPAPRVSAGTPVRSPAPRALTGGTCTFTRGQERTPPRGSTSAPQELVRAPLVSTLAALVHVPLLARTQPLARVPP